MGDYDNIIHLPHHQSATRPHMSMVERAAQFSPFAALTGYEDVLEETARLTDRRVELSESEQAELDRQLQLLQERISERPVVSVTYFQPDEKKSGGAYEMVTGAVRRIDTVERTIILTDGLEIGIQDIYSTQICFTPLICSTLSGRSADGRRRRLTNILLTQRSIIMRNSQIESVPLSKKEFPGFIQRHSFFQNPFSENVSKVDDEFYWVIRRIRGL